MRVRLASILVAAAAVLSLAAAGCGGKAVAPATTPPPADPTPSPTSAVSDAELDATMRQGLAYLVELGDSLAEVTAGDCSGVAAVIEASVARHGAVLAAVSSYDRDPVLKVRSDAWMDSHRGEINGAGERIGPALAPCTEDAAVQAAVGKLSPP